ncbi:hypothetical protein BV22DRAFT_257409 [Leucogyrophana mollusca]|uniref:Uncharacterized protein n=1 Tax=Leucogyrophana mollusca TaxID=85980 RepID=A0ACB8BR51_9AGAM|nr:hypothetical protein BV22DRAFT_257409 [Leucogyrophana mollusca]
MQCVTAILRPPVSRPVPNPRPSSTPGPFTKLFHEKQINSQFHANCSYLDARWSQMVPCWHGSLGSVPRMTMVILCPSRRLALTSLRMPAVASHPYCRLPGTQDSDLPRYLKPLTYRRYVEYPKTLRFGGGLLQEGLAPHFHKARQPWSSVPKPGFLYAEDSGKGWFLRGCDSIGARSRIQANSADALSSASPSPRASRRKCGDGLLTIACCCKLAQ